MSLTFFLYNTVLLHDTDNSPHTPSRINNHGPFTLIISRHHALNIRWYNMSFPFPKYDVIIYYYSSTTEGNGGALRSHSAYWSLSTMSWGNCLSGNSPEVYMQWRDKCCVCMYGAVILLLLGGNTVREHNLSSLGN